MAEEARQHAHRFGDETDLSLKELEQRLVNLAHRAGQYQRFLTVKHGRDADVGMTGGDEEAMTDSHALESRVYSNLTRAARDLGMLRKEYQARVRMDRLPGPQ